MNELTQQGIAALKSGDRAGAFHKLAAAVHQNPNDLTAWMWLSGTVQTEQAQIDCLRQVLRIDPGNTAAARGLAKILEQRTRPEAVNALPAAPQLDADHLPVGLNRKDALPTEVSPVVNRVEIPASPVSKSQPEVYQPPAEATMDYPEEPQPVGVVGDLRADLRASEQPQIDEPELEQPQPELLSPEQSKAVSPEQQGVVQGAPVQTYYRPAPHKEVIYSNLDKRIVFKTRPSHVPSLITFWILFIGAAYTSNLLSQDFITGALFALGLGTALEAAVIYTVIVNFKTFYELTDQGLHLHIVSQQGLGQLTDLQKRDFTILLEDIYATEPQQNFLQQLFGISDLRVDAVIDGRLGSVRLRGIPHADNRARQIMYLVNENR